MKILKMPYNAPAGFDWVTGLESWTTDGAALHLTARTAGGSQAALTFRAESPEIWHFSFVPPGGALDPATPILTAAPGPAVPLTVAETERGITASGPCLTLEIDRDPWMIRLLDAAGRDVLRENPSDIDGLGRPFILPLGYTRAQGKVTSVTETFHLRTDEHLFGLGEKFTRLDKVGQQVIAWTQDALGSTSERSHKNIPLLISTRGYGLFLDTGARITWDLGNVSCQSYTITAETAALDGYIIYGPTPAQILERYTALTGRAPVPPKWSFGVWLSAGEEHRDQTSVKAMVDEAEQRDLPVDVIHIDPWWMRWRVYCDFRWNRESFPDPQGMIDDLHARGLRLSLWQHPYISSESDLFEVGQREGYFLKRPDGEVYTIDYGLSLSPRPQGEHGDLVLARPEDAWNAKVAIIDLTNPDAYGWYQDLHRPLLQMGVDAFKTDFGEDVPADAVFHNGQTGATMHNLYPLLYNRAVYEVMKQERGYSVVWGRSGTAGSQRYPVCWSGDPAADFDSLACTIRGGLSIGLSGVPFWSNDIGSFRGMPSPRLYARWAQYGLFCSHSRIHGDTPRDPWVFGDEVLEITRTYARLRYRLFPYLYSTAHEASRTGLPVLRAMPLVFPDDPNALDKDLQYLFGPWLLVAPIYDEGETRSVYLPAGRWIDYWSGQQYDGPATITVHAPLDTLPLFVRGGAILPQMLPSVRIPEGLIDPLIVEVYPHEQSAYTLYEDEGTSEFTCAAGDREITLEARLGVARKLLLRFNVLAEVRGVALEASGEGGAPAAAEWRRLDNGNIEVELDRAQIARITLRR